MVRLVSSVRFRQGAPRRRSSVGQSTRLIIVLSRVRVPPPLPADEDQQDQTQEVTTSGAQDAEERETSPCDSRLRGLQAEELHNDEEPPERSRAHRAAQVLPVRQAPHPSQRNPLSASGTGGGRVLRARRSVGSPGPTDRPASDLHGTREAFCINWRRSWFGGRGRQAEIRLKPVRCRCLHLLLALNGPCKA
jgi:hypothetical protein